MSSEIAWCVELAITLPKGRGHPYVSWASLSQPEWIVSKAEEFHAKAAECDRKAEQAKDIEAKRLLKEAADNWRSMASQAERQGC
jgi:hypothetical protein